jgi:hypothetical protein
VLKNVIELLAAGNYDEGMGVYAKLLQGAGRGRDALLGQICEALPAVDAKAAAHLALGGGALVEDGAPADVLGRALVGPLGRALADAGRVIDAVAAMPEVEVEHEGEDEAEHDHGEEVIVIAGKHVATAELRTLAARDRAATVAWQSMNTWYRPAVAAWTRAPHVLREVQGKGALRAAVNKLGADTSTSHWLSQLLAALVDATLIIRFPELGETWTLVADGVTDMGQLSVLLSEALAEPLGRIGVTDRADARMLDVMRGRGPQQDEGTYGCAFHCYPIEAVDLADGMPKDGHFMWRAPGGTGTHSLPPDFLPGELTAQDGVRELVVVGPNSPGMRFVRVIPAVRTFDALEAHVRDARRVS